MKNEFQQVDFGPIQEYLDNDDVTDISYSNRGQVWLKTLSKGVYRVENPKVNDAFMEKMAFQCANSMGKSFNMANPFLDAESDELRMNFVHDSIAKNGIAVLIRKTPAKIRLEKEKIIGEDYIRLDIHDFILKCVEGHCNILVSGETGSGKTEFVKYMAAHTKYDEKIITIEDTLELHLDKIFPERDIVAMKTNNIANYADVLVTCMRQNPRWILLSEVRSAEAVMAVRDSISSGHNILSTIHADKAESIPSRLYSLLESSIDMDQFLRSIHRYVQLGVHIKGYYSKELQRFKREVAEVVEFYVDDDNNPEYKLIYKKTPEGKTIINNPSKYLLGYLESQGVIMAQDVLVKEQFHNPTSNDNVPTNNQVNLPTNTVENNSESTVSQSNITNQTTQVNTAPVQPTTEISAPITSTVNQTQAEIVPEVTPEVIPSEIELESNGIRNNIPNQAPQVTLEQAHSNLPQQNNNVILETPSPTQIIDNQPQNTMVNQQVGTNIQTQPSTIVPNSGINTSQNLQNNNVITQAQSTVIPTNTMPNTIEYQQQNTSAQTPSPTIIPNASNQNLQNNIVNQPQMMYNNNEIG